MAFADIQANTVFGATAPAAPFTAAQQQTILDAMKTAYEGSATAKAMFDDWIAGGNKITIVHETGQLAANLAGSVFLDLNFFANTTFIDPNGNVVADTLLTGLVHELGHALAQKKDGTDGSNNLDFNKPDYKGDNVTFVNQIYQELGLPEQVSYVAYDTGGVHQPVGHQYTNGAAIDVAVTVINGTSYAPSGDFNSDNGASTRDLLIGDSTANTLQSGKGDDFLFGGGDDDRLLGGAGKDTVIYLDDKLDYDVRLQDDGSWIVRHVRGDKDEGEDTVINAEVIQFNDGETFNLKKNGLTFQQDFALVIDTTGSMGDDIDGVKADAAAIIDALLDGNTDARIGVVGYKDETNGEPPSVILPFTDHDEFADRKAAAISAINGITVSGGGDLPETYYGGLLAALQRLDWRPGAGTLQIAAFTDASAKDGHLFAQVAALAADMGVTVTGSSSVTGARSAIDTFELSFEGDGASTAGRSELDDDPHGVTSPTVLVDEAIEPDATTTATLKIYSIFTGPTGVDTADLESIADETGGTFLTATTPEELVTALIDIIEAPSGLVGTPGPDVLVGGPEDDTITGLAGNDRLAGNRGDDTIEGNRGNDFLFGRAGNDELFGGRDHDVVRGGWGSDLAAGGLGNDRLYGGPGDDLLLGGPGNDVARGGPGSDELRGGAGHDTLRGGFDDDRLLGGRGADELFGFVGDDELRGGPGNDVLRGGLGADLVAGGRGDDLLFGGPGSDRLFGAPGSDTFIFGDSDDLGTGPDRDVVVDFLPGTDVLNLSHIDADTTVDGDQAFSFIGAAAFSSAGELRYAGDILSGDVNGDGVADFEIAFANSALLTSDDMLL